MGAFRVISCISFTSISFSDFKLAGFWGSNVAYQKTNHHEYNLDYYCSQNSYDIIIIDLLHIFFDDQNESKFLHLGAARWLF